jgi:hypothetical protein
MTWRIAFIRQARSDDKVRQLLNRPDVEYSHRLHYLQMTSEKLAKGLMATDQDPPPQTHRMLVRILQILKGRPEYRKKLGFSDAAKFRRYIDSPLVTAELVERLAPSIAGMNQPNPEYPWQDVPTRLVRTPIDFDFALYDPGNSQMAKLERLITDLLRIAQ